jgi:hypothetical protein
MRKAVWAMAGALALLGCGSITPLVATPDAGSTRATALPDAATPPEAGPGPKPVKVAAPGEDGMGDGNDDGPGGAKKEPPDASPPPSGKDKD